MLFGKEVSRLRPIPSVGHEPGGPSSRVCSCIDPCSARAGSSMTEGYPVRSHVIQPQLPRPLTFPFPISANTYYSRDLKGISKSARTSKSILAARAHSSILKYLGDSSRLEHLGGSSLLESARAKVLPGSSLRAQGCLEPSMLEQRSRLDSSRLVSNTNNTVPDSLGLSSLAPRSIGT